MSSCRTQSHMCFKDSMYAMQYNTMRIQKILSKKKMSTFLPRRLSFLISLWFHVPLEVAVALSSDRWPLRKAKKRARSSRMAWRRLGENFRWKLVKMWSTVNNGFESCNFAPIRSVRPSPCSLYIEGSNLLSVLGWILYNHSNSSHILLLLVTGDFWQLGFEVLIQRKLLGVREPFKTT